MVILYKIKYKCNSSLIFFNTNTMPITVVSMIPPYLQSINASCNYVLLLLLVFQDVCVSASSAITINCVCYCDAASWFICTIILSCSYHSSYNYAGIVTFHLHVYAFVVHKLLCWCWLFIFIFLKVDGRWHAIPH